MFEIELVSLQDSKYNLSISVSKQAYVLVSTTLTSHTLVCSTRMYKVILSVVLLLIFLFSTRDFKRHSSKSACSNGCVSLVIRYHFYKMAPLRSQFAETMPKDTMYKIYVIFKS